MTSNSGNVPDIFDLLILGKKIQLSFDTHSNFLTFRAKLYKYKQVIEPEMLELEIVTEIRSLSILLINSEDNTYTFQFVDKKVNKEKQYKFEVIEE